MKEDSVVKLMKEWKDEVLGIANDYTDAIKKLDLVRTDLENLKKNFWITWVLKPFLVIIIPIVLILGAARFLPCGVNIDYSGLKVSTTACR